MNIISKIEDMFHDENPDISIRLNELLELIDKIKDNGIYDHKYIDGYNMIGLVMGDIVIILTYYDDMYLHNIRMNLKLLISNILLDYSSIGIGPKNVYKYRIFNDTSIIFDNFDGKPIKLTNILDKNGTNIPKPEKIIKSSIKSARN